MKKSLSTTPISLIFGKGRGKKKRITWKWKGQLIETVKEFVYLGFRLPKNGNINRHVQERVKKANVAMGQVWGIGERIFEDNFRSRMFMFDYLIKGILFHGVEIFG